MLFSAELPWCCFMCRKEKFSKCPENPRRHFLELIRISGWKKYTRGPMACPRDRGGASPPVGRAPLSRGPLGPPPTSTPTPYIPSRGEKNQRESFIVFYDMEPPPPPVLHREGWSGVRSGLRRGGFVATIITNLPPSPISWCSLLGVSNSIKACWTVMGWMRFIMYSS